MGYRCEPGWCLFLALPCCQLPRRERAPCLGQAPEPSWGVLGFILLLLHALAWGGGQSSGQTSCPLAVASPASPNPPAAFEEVAPERGDGSQGQAGAGRLPSLGEGVAGPSLCCGSGWGARTPAGCLKEVEDLGLLPWTQEHAWSLGDPCHGRYQRRATLSVLGGTALACLGALPKVLGCSLVRLRDGGTCVRRVLGRIALSSPARVRLEVMPASCVL